MTAGRLRIGKARGGASDPGKAGRFDILGGGSVDSPDTGANVLRVLVDSGDPNLQSTLFRFRIRYVRGSNRAQLAQS